MKLFKLLNKCKVKFSILNKNNIDIKGVSTSSNQIKSNYIFGAIKGTKFNGEDFIDSLKKFKEIVVVVKTLSNKVKEIKNDFIVIICKDVDFLIAEIASILYKSNIKEMIAVTGTNGKTSVASYTKQIWESKNIKCASVGTLGFQYNKFFHESFLTTPLPEILHKKLLLFSKERCKHVIIEASSIGIHKKRLHPIKFQKICFTNFSRDHLDYHKNLKNYLNAKLDLVRNHTNNNSIAVINSDNKYSQYFYAICKKQKVKILDFGKKASFLKIKKILKEEKKFLVELFFKNQLFTIELRCLSEFQIYNQISALVLVYGDRLKLENFDILNVLNDPKGRLEKVYDKEYKIFIDYAHTPDALRNVLKSLKNNIPKKIITLIGCGGERDKGKRHLLTKQAVKFSDLVILADDNPRNEDPSKIRLDMIKGLKHEEIKKVLNIGDREKAITKGIKLLKKGDVFLIAGKGHENYQVIKNKKVFFSDHKTVLRIVK